MAEVTLRVYRSGSAQNLIDLGTSGEYVDLDLNQESVNFKVDLSSVQNQDLGKMYSLGSQAFALPSTLVNDVFFNYSGDPGSVDDNLILQKTFDCQILIDGGAISNGKLYIDSIVRKPDSETIYQCSFNDSVSGLAAFLKNVALGDLNWIDYDHQYSLTNITSSWEGDLLNGEITYPLCQYGNLEGDTFTYTMDENNPNSIFASGSLITQCFKPAVRIKTLVDRIFDLTPFEYSSSFISGGADFFGNSGKTMDDLYMLMTADEERGIVDSVPNLVILSSDPQSVINNSDVEVRSVTDEVVDTAGQYNPATGIFTAAFGGTFNFSVVPVVISSTNVPVKVRTKILNTGTTVLAQSPLSEEVIAVTGGTGIEGQSLTLDLVEGQQVQLKIFVTSTSTDPYQLGAICEYECLTPQPDVTILDEQFGDLSCVDFLRGLQQHFNLVFWTDYNDPNLINIEPYNTWADSGERLDWTDKVDHSQGIEIFHPAREQNKDVVYTYKTDNGFPNRYNKEIYNKELGTFEYESTSDYSQGSRTIGNKFFAQTIVGPLQGAGSNLSGSNMVIPKIHNDQFKPYKFEPRLLWFNGTGSLDDKEYNIFDDVFNNSGSFSYYPLFNTATSFEQGSDKFTLDWQPQGYWRAYDGIPGYGHWTNNTLYNQFWARWVNNIYRAQARKVVCNIKFTPADIFEFNLNDLIHIDGHDYRINKISGFNLLKDESVKVELLKELSPINSVVYLNGSNTITGADGGYSGPGSPSNGDEFTWVDDATDPDAVVPTTTPDNNGPSGPDTPIDPADIPQVTIYKGGYKPSTDTGTGAVTIRQNVSIGRNSFEDTSTAAVQNNPDNKPTNGLNNIVSPTSTFVSITGDNNEIGGGAKRIAIVGDSNKIAPNANQVLVVGDNFDTSGGGTIDTTILIGDQGGTLDDNTDISNAFVVGLASNIETTFNDGVLLGRNSVIRGTLGFQDCAFSTYGIVDADDYVGTATQMLASTFLGNPVKTSFDNDLDATYYNTSVILGKRFDFGAVNKGFVEETAMGAAQNYNVNSTDVVVFLDGGGGTGTCQLPDATANEGRVVTIKSRVTAGTGASAISDTAGNLVEGGLTYTLNATENYDFATFMSDGSDWWLIGRK